MTPTKRRKLKAQESEDVGPGCVSTSTARPPHKMSLAMENYVSLPWYSTEVEASVRARLEAKLINFVPNSNNNRLNNKSSDGSGNGSNDKMGPAVKKTLLCIPATSILSERVFSSSGFLFNRRRRQMSEEI